MIRELEAREIEKIYREEMTGDFPAEELKPIDLILRLKAEGRYCAFGNFEGEKLTAYAFLIHEKDDPVYLLDFFAVCRGGRDQGIDLVVVQHHIFGFLQHGGIERGIPKARQHKRDCTVFLCQGCQSRLFFHRNDLRKRSVIFKTTSDKQ